MLSRPLNAYAERDELLQLCRQRLDKVKLLGVVLPEKADPAGQAA